MKHRTERILRKSAIAGSIAIVLLGGVSLLFPSPAAADGTISVENARIVCNDFNATRQVADGIKLRGHINTITQECSSGNRPPVSTLAALCRVGLSSFDGAEGVANEDLDDNSPGAKNYPIRTTLAANPGEIHVFLSETGIAACTSTDFCFDYGPGAQCSGTISNATPPVEQPPPKTEINVFGIMKLSNGFEFYALLAAVVGICVSASLWAMGSKGQNPGTELAGKKGMIVCCTAAFIAGATPQLIAYFDRAGSTPGLDTNGITANQLKVVSKESAPAPTVAPAVIEETQVRELRARYEVAAYDQNLLVVNTGTWTEQQDAIADINEQLVGMGKPPGPANKDARINQLRTWFQDSCPPKSIDIGEAGAKIGAELQVLGYVPPGSTGVTIIHC